jgi:hypothetical protein
MTVGMACTSRMLETPLERGPRLLLLFAILLIGVGFVAPLWNVAFSTGGAAAPSGTVALMLAGSAPTPEAPAGLRSYGFERIWIAAGLVALALLFARAAAVGTLRSLVDSFVLYFLFGAAALRLLGFELARVGGPGAGTGRPGWPLLLFGRWQSAGAEFAASPGVGAWILAVVAIVLAYALTVAWRGARRELASDFVVAG